MIHQREPFVGDLAATLTFRHDAYRRDDDANGCFRTVPRFETAAPKYAFLNHLLAVGGAEIRAEGPIHVIEEAL